MSCKFKRAFYVNTACVAH